MSWTCEKCGTLHDTLEQISDCRRAQGKATRFAVAFFVSIALAILAIELAWNEYAYSDWKCTFMHCRKLVP